MCCFLLFFSFFFSFLLLLLCCMLKDRRFNHPNTWKSAVSREGSLSLGVRLHLIQSGFWFSLLPTPPHPPTLTLVGCMFCFCRVESHENLGMNTWVSVLPTTFVRPFGATQTSCLRVRTSRRLRHGLIDAPRTIRLAVCAVSCSSPSHTSGGASPAAGGVSSCGWRWRNEDTARAEHRALSQ